MSIFGNIFSNEERIITKPRIRIWNNYYKVFYNFLFFSGLVWNANKKEKKWTLIYFSILADFKIWERSDDREKLNEIKDWNEFKINNKMLELERLQETFSENTIIQIRKKIKAQKA